MKPRSEFETKFAGLAVTFAMLLSLAIPTRVSAQMVGGTISGTVVDPSGAVIADVKISVTNAATGSVANAATNSVGVFVAPNLPPGTYEVSASATGFSTLVRNRITLTVGQELVLNLTLQIGNSSQQIEVSTEAPTVDLANATIGGVVTEATVEALPLNGRSWSDLAILAPGVHLVGNQPAISSTDRTKRGMGLELSISGGRPQQNNYLLDGVNINNYTNAGPGSLLGGNLGTDAVGLPCSPPTIQPSTGAPQAASSARLPNRGQTNSMGVLTSSSATIPWMPQISLIIQMVSRNRPFGETNLEVPLEAQFKRTRHSSLVTMRGSGRVWARQCLQRCLRQPTSPRQSKLLQWKHQR